MLHTLAHALEHTLSDIVQAIPILLIVYALLYWIENRLRSTPALLEKSLNDCIESPSFFKNMNTS